MFHRTLAVKRPAFRQILWAFMGYLPECLSALDDAQMECGTITFKGLRDDPYHLTFEKLEDESYHLTLEGSDADPVLLRMWERAQLIAAADTHGERPASGLFKTE